MLSYFLTALIFSALISINTDIPCNKIVTRPEIRDLSKDALSRFISAVKQVNSGTRPTKYDSFVKIHINNAVFAHGTASFFHWHREYIRRFELLLQTVEKDVVLPYWDWSSDYLNPSHSRVMKDILGGNGIGESKCVSEGLFANWTIGYPDVHCLKRDYDLVTRLSPFYSTKSVLNMVSNLTKFSDFSTAIEALPHGIVHSNIGNLDGDMNYYHSSNDIVFWLHHCFVDLIYWEWQQQNVNVSLTHNGITWEGKEATLQDMLIPFDVSVQDTIDVSSSRYCYKYDRLGTKSGDKEANQVTGTNSPNTKQQLNTLNSESSSTSSNAPHKIPQAWLEKNNINVTLARSLESKFRSNIN